MALVRLAVGLRLGRAERGYLFEVAQKRDPDEPGGEIEDVPPAVNACVAAVTSPAYVLDRSWTARAWNAPAERLFVGWLDRPGERNLLRFIFLEPTARSLICAWGERARRVAAEFRAACGAHVDHPSLRALIAELRQQSSAFAQFWDQHGILGREGGERTFHHPLDGFLRYEQLTFNVASQPDLKLTVLVPKPPILSP